MIPDVPRSLRDQLKKENMMLMEFLLNQDQEARAKSHSPKRPNSCFPAHIDIVVEAPEREQEEVETEGVESVVCGLGRSSDSDPEFSNEESHQEEPEGKDEDEAGDGGEKETQLEGNEEDVEEVLEKQQEGDEETEDKCERREEEAGEVKTAENCSVDLDFIMSEMGLLGEEGELDTRLQLHNHMTAATIFYPLQHVSIFSVLHIVPSPFCVHYHHIPRAMYIHIYIVGVYVAAYLLYCLIYTQYRFEHNCLKVQYVKL